METIQNKVELKDFPEKEPFIRETEISGLLIIRRPRFADERGSFQEEFRIPDIEKVIGRKVEIRQTQISDSEPRVLRGIHAEPQDKIITPLTGKLLAVIVDLRPDSRTFKKWIMLDIDNTVNLERITLFVPEGLGNAFYVYPDSPKVLYQYAVTKTYDSKTAGMGVRFNDESLGIPWPDMDPKISDRDRQLPTLEEFLQKFR